MTLKDYPPPMTAGLEAFLLEGGWVLFGWEVIVFVTLETWAGSVPALRSFKKLVLDWARGFGKFGRGPGKPWVGS